MFEDKSILLICLAKFLLLFEQLGMVHCLKFRRPHFILFCGEIAAFKRWLNEDKILNNIRYIFLVSSRIIPYIPHLGQICRIIFIARQKLTI